MRKMYQSQMPGVPPQIQQVFNEIFRASQDADIIDIGQAYDFVNGAGVTVAYTTRTRKLNVTTPTLANTVEVLATLIADLKAGGSTKSG